MQGGIGQEEKPLPGRDCGDHDCHFWPSPVLCHELISYLKPSKLLMAYPSEKYPSQKQH